MRDGLRELYSSSLKHIKLNNKDVILDIGANEGHYTILANNIMHDSKIYSIEANPELCKNLLAIDFKNKNSIFVQNNILV